ncbi:MAG TPA: hypothetical protein VL371_25790, partial [Gemmataceae bacterium]|nr:hypothetical protein [Gemmataceae bacterium]
MADHRVPTPTAEHRRIAAEGFERARQVITTGNFAQAIKLWELVRKAVPADVEATHKAKDLAASETIQRGQYENAMEG